LSRSPLLCVFRRALILASGIQHYLRVALQGMVVRYEAADDMPAIEGVPVIYGDCAFDQRGHIMSPFRAPFAVPQERQVNLDYSRYAIYLLICLAYFLHRPFRRTRISEEHLQGLTGIYFGFWLLSIFGPSHFDAGA
jgi:hypothetical protein